MPEHVHLVVHPCEANYDMARIRRAIKGPVGTRAIEYLQSRAPEWLPRITRQRGLKRERLFWQSGGGYDRNITTPSTLQKMIDYIHLNPVRRGLVERARDWKWSSAGWFEEVTNDWLLPDDIPPEWAA